MRLVFSFFLLLSFTLNVTAQNLGPEPFRSTIPLVDIGYGKIFTLSNVYFEFDDDVLKKQSNLVLDSLVDYLNKYLQLYIEVRNHRNPTGGQMCSEVTPGRARSVAEYLIEKGIDKKRISYKGFGDSQPIISAEAISKMKDEAERAISMMRNSRTEIRLYLPDAVPQSFNLEEIKSRATELQMIGFYLGKWELTKGSYQTLDSLVAFMERTPGVVLEVATHHAPVFSQMCMSLSQKRSMSIVEYLISKGVDPERLVAKGYGDAMPYVVREKNKYFKKGTILDADFYSKTKDEKLLSQARMLSNRVEVSVLRIDYKPRLKPKQ